MPLAATAVSTAVLLVMVSSRVALADIPPTPHGHSAWRSEWVAIVSRHCYCDASDAGRPVRRRLICQWRDAFSPTVSHEAPGGCVGPSRSRGTASGASLPRAGHCSVPPPARRSQADGSSHTPGGGRPSLQQGSLRPGSCEADSLLSETMSLAPAPCAMRRPVEQWEGHTSPSVYSTAPEAQMRLR